MLVGTVPGMNFDHIPELHWAGYPLALAPMLATSVTLYVVFKRRGWLYRGPHGGPRIPAQAIVVSRMRH